MGWSQIRQIVTEPPALQVEPPAFLGGLCASSAWPRISPRIAC